QPYYGQVDEKISFRSTKGQFYRTKLAVNFGAVWTGYLRVEKAGTHTLSLRSDDGSRLYIGDQLVIDNARPAAEEVMKDKTADVQLAAGDYPIRVEYFNLGGPGGMQLWWKNAEGKMTAIPAGRLFHDPGQEKVDFDQ